MPGVAVDHPAEDGARRHFGNMILSRLPVRQVFRASAAVPGRSRRQRHAAHRARGGDRRAVRRSARDHDASRVVFEGAARGAGRGAARDLRRGPRARASKARSPTRRAARSTRTCGPRRRSSPATSISSPIDPLHARMQAPFADGTPPLLDAWEALNPGVPHPSTFCIYMKMEPGGPELHCDFYFVSADLQPRLEVDPRRPADAGVRPPAGDSGARLAAGREPLQRRARGGATAAPATSESSPAATTSSARRSRSTQRSAITLSRSRISSATRPVSAAASSRRSSAMSSDSDFLAGDVRARHFFVVAIHPLVAVGEHRQSRLDAGDASWRCGLRRR